MAALPRRILKETQKLTQDPVPGIEAIPDEKNARYFHIKVFGPADSPYENGKPDSFLLSLVFIDELSLPILGKFDLELFLPEEYPMAPPKVRFMTKIFHPNIDKLGRICLDGIKS